MRTAKTSIDAFQRLVEGKYSKDISFSDNDRIIRFKYFVLENYLECIKGNCKNYQPEIDYILTEYQAISSIL